MLSVINEAKLVQDLNTEYYRLINFYSNIKRQSTFIQYYNIDPSSPRNPETQETFDFYSKTRSVWNVYDLTPTQIIAAIQNSPDNMADLKGQMIISATTITTYTIENPRIGDLVTFYKPAKAGEVLRVRGVRLQLNSNISMEPVKWYELDLETAPIRYEQLLELNKLKHFVYDLVVEKNVEYVFYKKHVEAMTKLNELLNYFNKFYIKERDLYAAELKIPRETNELIFYIKKNFDDKYRRLFELNKSPFGFWDHYFPFKYKNIEEMKFNKTKEFEIIDYFTRENEIVNLSTYNYEEELENCLKKTIELLEYSKKIKEYLEHVRS